MCQKSLQNSNSKGSKLQFVQKYPGLFSFVVMLLTLSPACKDKKRYNTGNRVGYSATLECAGMAALNPRASGNGSLLLDVSRCACGGARLCV